MKRLQVVLTAFGFLVALGLVGNADREEAERQRAQYCDMVEMWHDTGGNAGWPPYDGECEP